MGSNYVGVDSFSANLTLQTDDDSPSAAIFRLPNERLLDNDVHVRNRAAALETRATALEALVVPASDTVAGLIEVAVQSEQEAGTSTTRAVTPGRQHFHPSAAKFWAHVTVSAGTPTLTASYNVTSITDSATGVLIVTIANDFSSANWAALLSFRSTTTPQSCQITNQSTGACTGTVFNSSTAVAADPDAWSFAGFGDL